MAMGNLGGARTLSRVRDQRLPAHEPDASHVARGQDELAKRNLLPKRQFVDGSYIGSQLVLEGFKKHGIELVGPVKQNSHRTQIRNGYELSAFTIDWDNQVAICPQGKRSGAWSINTSKTGRQVLSAKFPTSLKVLWLGKIPFAERGHCLHDQPSATRQLLDRNSSCPNASFRVCSARAPNVGIRQQYLTRDQG
jgi:hypothetical protein